MIHSFYAAKDYFTPAEIQIIADALDAFEEPLEDMVTQHGERPRRDLVTFTAARDKIERLRKARP